MKVLLTGDPWQKADYADLAASLWLHRKFQGGVATYPRVPVPHHPTRHTHCRLPVEVEVEVEKRETKTKTDGGTYIDQDGNRYVAFQVMTLTS